MPPASPSGARAAPGTHARAGASAAVAVIIWLCAPLLAPIARAQTDAPGLPSDPINLPAPQSTAAFAPRHALPKILFLHSHDAIDPYTHLQTEGFMEGLTGNRKGFVEGYREYLFLNNNNARAQPGALAALILARYEGADLDLISITDTRALDFWSQYLSDRFPGVPVVFSGATHEVAQMHQPGRLITGVMETIDAVGTLRFIRATHPTSKRIGIVLSQGELSDRTEGEFLRQVDASPEKAQGFEVVPIRTASFETLREEIKRNDLDTLIHVSGPWRDPRMRMIQVPEWVRENFPKVPVYALLDGGVQPFVLGGQTSSGLELGRVAGAMARRIITQGVKPSDIPIDRAGAVVPVARWEELDYWDIPEHALPPGTQVLGRPPSWLIRHERSATRWAASLAVLVALTTVAITARLLLVQRRRRRTEEALREADRRLNLAVDSARLGTWEADISTGIFRGSDACCDMYATPRGAPVRRTEFLGRVHPGDLPAVARAWNECVNGSGAYRCTYRVRVADGSYRLIRVEGGAVRDAQGRNVRVVGVSADITDENVAAQRLAESQDRLRLMAENLGEAFWMVEPDGETIRYASEGFGPLWGRKPGEITGCSVRVLHESIHPDDRASVESLRRSQVESPSEEQSEVQFRITRTDGAVRWVSCRTRAVLDESGAVRCFLGVQRDVTERVESRKVLEASERRLADLIHNAPVGFVEWDAQWRCTLWDGRAGAMFGWTAAEVLGKHLSEWKFAHEDDMHGVLAGMAKMEAERAPIFRSTNRNYTKDGTVRVCEWTNSNIFDADGRRLSTLSMVADITERENALQRLRKSEELHRLVASAVTETMYDLDFGADRVTMRGNFDHLPYADSPGPHPVSEFIENIHPEDAPRIKESLRGLFASEETRWTGEYRHRRRDGSWGLFSDRATIVRDESGVPVRMVGAMNDITDERLAAEALEASDKRIRTLIDSTRCILWETRPETMDFGFVSGPVERILGYPVEDWLKPGFWASKIHPEDRDQAVNFCMVQSAKGLDHEFEYRMIAADGSIVWLHDAVTVDRGGGDGLRLRGAMMDISEFKKSQEKLAQSEELHRLAANAGTEIIYDWDIESNQVFKRGSSGRMPHVDPDLPHSVEDFIASLHPEDVPRTRESLKAALANGADHWTAEYRHILRDGSWGHFSDRAAIVRDASGKPVRVVGAMTDVTAQRGAEAALRESERRFREMAENIDQMFWIRTAEPAELIYISPACRKFWGLEPSELLGPVSKWRAFLHPEDRERVIGDLEGWFDSGGQGTYTNEYRLVIPDGSVRWVSNRGVMIHDPDGRRARVVGVTVDITPRKHAEMVLENTLRTQGLLLAELDHRVKNNLTGLLSLIDMTAARETDASRLAEAMRRRVGAMVNVHTVLSSVRWEPMCLRRMVSALGPPGDAPGKFDASGADVSVPASRATALGMILQELLANALKYGALGAVGGRVELRWESETQDETVSLTLRWNETGGPPITTAPVPGLGTSLIDGFARHELRGSADLRYPRNGASHTIRVDITPDPSNRAEPLSSRFGVPDPAAS